VLVGSRNLEHGETAATSVGADARAVQFDVTNQASIAAAAERIRNELSRLDVLVNNAGIARPRQDVAELTAAARKGTRTVPLCPNGSSVRQAISTYQS